MNSSVILGIAGTAKNTGKTTALNALLAEAHARRVPVAVTSIGYDGESVDNVTGLAKPRIVLHEGTIATTSRSCLPMSGWEVLEQTEWSTPLGQVLVVRCLQSGPIVLAGPSTRRELSAIVERMRGLGPALTLVDGALNRLAPMSVASALVLSTGAARSPGLTELARETAAIESILDLPSLMPPSGALVVDLAVPFATPQDVQKVVASLGKGEVFLRLLGPVSPITLRALARLEPGARIVQYVQMSDPVVALLSAEPTEMAETITECRSHGMMVGAERPLPLACITINPFLPRFDGRGYVADQVPANALKAAIVGAVRSPVVDVMRDGAATLWNALKSASDRHSGL